jgi:methylmalonyl-CoA/ethylmalonyl-CoA epimerase
MKQTFFERNRMPDITLDHIGIAVEDLEEAVNFFTEVLGLSVEEREEVPGQGVQVVKLNTGKTTIELIKPLSVDSPVGRFIAKKGQGVHHICFGVSDALPLVARAGEEGVRALGSGLSKGASGKQVIFFHPSDTFGTLVELAQPTEGK